jgi:D-alanyl-D-alanine carboxypeptidase/D-alanyl-D-alanine-endopeptidase (penicillin-binding protein 4)
MKNLAACENEMSRLNLRKIFALILISAVTGLPVSAQSAAHRAGAPGRGGKSAPATRERPGVAAFRARVEKILAAADVNRGYWGMLVEDADSGEVLYSLNADRYFLPASNAKLFTAALTLATLGTDYCFHTTVESRSALSGDGVLAGDVVLVGRGDPNLSNRVFPFAKKAERDGPPEKILAEMADAVVARGVKKITGDVVGDDSYFAGGAYPSGWAIDDMLWSYGVPVSALEVNDGVFFLELQAGDAAGAPATYTISPSTSVYQIRNEVVTGPKGSPQKLSASRDPGSTLIIVSGSMPVGAQPHSMGIAIDRPAEFAAAVLKSLLEARGVVIEGHVRAQHTGDLGAWYKADGSAEMSDIESHACGSAAGFFSIISAAPIPPWPQGFAQHVSPPLPDALRVMAKISQNLHAEMFLRAAARQKTGDPSAEAALQFEQDFRVSIGLKEDDVVMTDASGLSRKDMVSPQSEVSLLRWVTEQPWAATYRSVLPVAGEDGTLMDRMKGTPAAGNVWAKTGSLTHVDSLAGYATSGRGAHLVFSFIGNNNNLKPKAATDVLDALTVAMVEELGLRRAAAHK